MTPWMGPNHWDRVKQACFCKTVLEYGSGASTSDLVLDGKTGFLLSVEHDVSWYAKICEGFGQNGDPFWPMLLPLKDPYIEIPLNYGPFDVVLVDGRCRRRCLEAVQDCLRPGARVFLHDAQRPWYEPGKALYHTVWEEPDPDWTENPQATLWEGKLP